ncbi:MAG: hypothetical protein LKI58_07840 [Actinomyces sp.]|jgi:hypothetical protein|nr:hypothetical protein [Actinomyces sp.]MCI1787961.1 hypothetical protein [Actinomyces sp.]MCI1867079.1 hypothetical protein [Actinomyces sp.]
MHQTTATAPRVDIWHRPELSAADFLRSTVSIPASNRDAAGTSRQCNADQWRARTSCPYSLVALGMTPVGEGEPLTSETLGLARVLGVLE